MYVCTPSPIHTTYEYYYDMIWTFESMYYECDAQLSP